MRYVRDVCPDLPEDNYIPTSPSTIYYNSFAWAIGIDNIVMEPCIGLNDQYYWPKRRPDQDNLEVLLDFYRDNGYELSSSTNLSQGVSRIAIYLDSYGEPIHAARQRKDGKWTSKIFDAEDIEHDSPECLEKAFGRPVIFLESTIN